MASARPTKQNKLQPRLESKHPVTECTLSSRTQKVVAMRQGCPRSRSLSLVGTECQKKCLGIVNTVQSYYVALRESPRVNLPDAK